LVTFRLGEDLYALELEVVQEVLRRCTVSPLPCLASHVRGILNLRGTVVAVLDPKPLLGIETGESGNTAIILRGSQAGPDRDAGEPVALLVDEIGEILPADDYTVSARHRANGRPRTGFVSACARTRWGQTSILDAQAILMLDPRCKEDTTA